MQFNGPDEPVRAIQYPALYPIPDKSRLRGAPTGMSISVGAPRRRDNISLGLIKHIYNSKIKDFTTFFTSSFPAILPSAQPAEGQPARRVFPVLYSVV